jgi:hypothetical protein
MTPDELFSPEVVVELVRQLRTPNAHSRVIRSTDRIDVWHREVLDCSKGGAPMLLIITRSAALVAHPFGGGTPLAG